MVPEYECREAAVYVHLSWAAFQKLPTRERAKVIAHYRLHLMIEAHVNDAAFQKSEQDAAKQRRKQR